MSPGNLPSNCSTRLKRYDSTGITAWLATAVMMMVSLLSCTAIPVQDNVVSLKPENSFAEAATLSQTGSIYWQQSFPSSRLRADISILRTQNYGLEAAQARVEQAAAAYGIKRSELMPSLDASGAFDRSKIQDHNSREATSSRSSISFGAAFRWEPDIWGRLRARTTAASLLLEEKRALSKQLSLHLQSMLVEAWINYQAAKNLESVLDGQKRTNQQILELTELRLAMGEGNALDVLQQKGRLAVVERIIPGVASERKSAANSYAALLGRLPGESPIGRDEWPELKPLTAITSPRQLLSTRPDLQAAYLALKAADHEVAAAIGDSLPRISIELVYTESGSNLSRLGDSTVYGFTSGLLAPLFDAGRLQKKVDEQKAAARERLAILEEAMLQAIIEVENSLIGEKSLFDEYKQLAKELEIAEKTVNQAKLQYVNGQQTFLPVLAALAKLQTLQQEQITLKKDIFINRGRLLKALAAEWSQEIETK